MKKVPTFTMADIEGCDPKMVMEIAQKLEAYAGECGLSPAEFAARMWEIIDSSGDSPWPEPL